MNPSVFFIVFFFIMLLVAGWITWCTQTYRIGIYRDKYGVEHTEPLDKKVPVDWSLQSIETHMIIVRGLGKGKSITI